MQEIHSPIESIPSISFILAAVNYRKSATRENIILLLFLTSLKNLFVLFSIFKEQRKLFKILLDFLFSLQSKCARLSLSF